MTWRERADKAGVALAWSYLANTFFEAIGWMIGP